MFTKGVAPQADLSTLRGSSGSDASPDLKVGKLYAYVEPRSHATKPKIAEEVCLSLVVCRKPWKTKTLETIALNCNTI